jgi:hypothetical protein
MAVAMVAKPNQMVLLSYQDFIRWLLGDGSKESKAGEVETGTMVKQTVDSQAVAV